MLSEIIVEELYGHKDKSFTLDLKNPIPILTGKNGSGKTSLLKILNEVIQGRYFTLKEYKFKSIEIKFSSGKKLKFEKTDSTLFESEMIIKEGTSKNDYEAIYYSDLGALSEKIPMDVLSTIEDEVPELDQMNRHRWRNLNTGEMLDIKEVVRRFAHRTSVLKQFLISVGYAGLTPNGESKLIQTNRLIQTQKVDHRTSRFNAEVEINAIERCSQKIIDIIKTETSKYLAISQDIDSKFPLTLIQQGDFSVTSEELTEAQKNLESMRLKLKEVGLLGDVDYLKHQTTDQFKMQVLYLYYKDSIEKLKYLQNLQNRLSIFFEMTNEKYGPQKSVKISLKDGLEVFGGPNHSEKLELRWLSSGEQHEIIMMFEVLFEVGEEAVILIDEPEISLHIDWQRNYLKDIMKIQSTAPNRQFIIATHSPAIIGKFRNLCQTVGPEK